MTERNKSGATVIQVGTATVRMSPVGFALYAEEFYIAAVSIPQQSRARGNTSFTPVPYYLLCRALELILKAFLLAEYRTLDELKQRYGHDLEKLWHEAIKHGLSEVVIETSSNFSSDLSKANSYYKGKAFEYFDFSRWAHGYKDLPPFERFRDDIKSVVEETKRHCFSVSQ